MEKEEKKGIFFGVIGVLTLIVAIIGASLAYFSLNARSEDDAITVQAASVKIVYEDGQKLELYNLIPSTEEIALKTQLRALRGEEDPETGAPYTTCFDDNNNRVCGIYDFTLTNDGANPVDVTATVVASELEENDIQFSHLNFAMYDLSGVNESTIPEGQNGTLITKGVVNYGTFGLFGSDTSITKPLAGGGGQNKYRLFIWLNEEGELNDPEQGAKFMGTVHIDVAGAGSGTVTGTVND